MKKALLIVCSIILAVIILFPIFMIITGAFMSKSQISAYLEPTLSQSAEGYSTWGIIPDFTLQYFIELLIDTPEFYVMFWNSIKIAVLTVIGQLLVGIPAAWVFARFKFRGKNIMLYIYTMLLVMPFIVLLLAQYIILQRINLLDTHWAIILPGIFSAMPFILVYPYFKNIPESFLEAARLEGAGELQIFSKIAVPLSKPAIIASCILNFVEYWGIFEQPYFFLDDKSKWNLSLFISNIDINNINISFVASVIAMIPAILLVVSGRDALEEGLTDVELKE